jgi:hypothetical protein
MRKIFLLIFFVSSFQLYADARLDSALAHSDIIVSGFIVRQDIALKQDDETMNVCRIGFRIVEIYPVTVSGAELIKTLQPGDTLQDLVYLADHLTDTLNIRTYYYIPLLRDSADHTKWEFADQHARTGVMIDPDGITCACPVRYVTGTDQHIWSIKTGPRTRWVTTTISDTSGKIIRTSKSRGSLAKYITFTTEYGDDQRKKYKARDVSKARSKGMHESTWVFRENGKLCFKRTHHFYSE